jgi:autotransporter translocation and assembly factor TamB
VQAVRHRRKALSAAAVVVAVVAVAGVRLLAEVENGADVLWQFAESEWVC